MTKARILANLISDNAELADGQISVAEVVGAAPLASPSFTGNITVSGNVDGRDIAADGTKLDGVEASADVTDATNVTAAGALMDSELTNIAAIKALNQGVATTDEVAFDNTTQNAIAKDISDTAVDVFVYDTSKDSDGGAWRKRTQHTSWYNEAASATRGSRKEFPAVAVIVAESTQLTIYDGDDPDLPMWRVFNRDTSTPTANNAWYRDASSFVVSSVAMKNGSLIFGVTVSSGTSNTTAGLLTADFIGDELRRKSSASANSVRGVPVAESNNNPVLQMVTSDPLISTIINDVAMTVLPNAPIDAATGLPVPTIAVATDSGVSVIKDDLTVVDSGDTNNFSVIKFSPNGTLIGMHSAGHRLRLFNDYNADGFTNTSFATNDVSGPQNALSPKTNDDGVDGVLYDNGFDWGFISGLTQMKLDDAAPTTQSMLSQATSTYATGYQVGDIKLATLSDTDTTNVTGSELVTNGTFASNTTGWTDYTSSFMTLSHVSGVARLTHANNWSGWYGIGQDITTVVGKTYVASYDVTESDSGNMQGSHFYLGEDTVLWGASGTYEKSGTITGTFVATSTTTNIRTGHGGVGVGSGDYYTIDNFSVRLAEEDRSLNGNGVQVFGTVIKSAVATGADLVGYSGFGNGNYLKQPYNSDLDFGTGTFSITTWAKIPAINSFSPTLVDRHVLNQARILLYAETGNQLPRIYIAHTNGSTSTYVTGPTAIDDGQWHCWHANRRGSGQLELWIDGVKVAYGGVGVDSISVSTNGPTIIGNDYTGGGTGYMNGDMALTRISATVPSPEQIAKIYEDEKHLFQEGAQATLYGSSDAVTALAYDDTTELLHVGTSAGRSVFQGLRRVDNTTDAVGAAISASNGLVAED